MKICNVYSYGTGWYDGTGTERYYRSMKILFFGQICKHMITKLRTLQFLNFQVFNFTILSYKMVGLNKNFQK